ncbi:MucR family transcriptional regulator [Sphingomonas baiyangensis]|uniref:Transcriptional regulator n=1 Tax=Sphingomonas baiyangensis TaxID=2572576 RepID=A0A4U1L5R9_9SPHN|nr:MucR family transcriptional regulator [Sphingomonas baiyangensis]TKD51556.1 transcriptional regulator [Sphingomonas baiyangensis]
MSEEIKLDSIKLATELTIAWLGNQNNRAAAEDVPIFLRQMHRTISELAGTTGAPGQEPVSEADSGFNPAVTVRKSLASKDHILSMIDGKPYKTLRRHLSRHGMTPEQYRERFNLKPDYPMVAENYSEARRAMAHKIGLGSKGRQASVTAASSEAKPKRARKSPVKPAE